MENKEEKQLKRNIDTFLIYNLFILIIGAILFLISILFSLNGNLKLYNLFQDLWYPLFIPALSLFFTAILIEIIVSKLNGSKQN